MNKRKEVVLYDIKRDNGDWLSLTVYYDGPILTFFAHDFTEIHELMFGDEEYEGYHTFDEENILKLKKLFNTDDLLDAISHYFNGKMKDDAFFKMCDKNNIKYKSYTV